MKLALEVEYFSLPVAALACLVLLWGQHPVIAAWAVWMTRVVVTMAMKLALASAASVGLATGWAVVVDLVGQLGVGRTACRLFSCTGHRFIWGD